MIIIFWAYSNEDIIPCLDKIHAIITHQRNGNNSDFIKKWCYRDALRQLRLGRRSATSLCNIYL